MTRHHPIPLVAAVLAAASLTGCGDAEFTSEALWHPERRLRVEIPAAATDRSVRPLDETFSGVDFLLPDDQWRDYVTRYLPDDALDYRPSGPNDPVPTKCQGTPAGRYTAERPFTVVFGAGREFTALRSVTVVPDCRPSRTYVSWTYYEPHDRHRPGPVLTQR